MTDRGIFQGLAFARHLPADRWEHADDRFVDLSDDRKLRSIRSSFQLVDLRKLCPNEERCLFQCSFALLAGYPMPHLSRQLSLHGIIWLGLALSSKNNQIVANGLSSVESTGE